MTDDNAATEKVALYQFIRERFPTAADLELEDDLSLLDAGIVDSLGILDLVTFLEDRFQVQVVDDDLMPENFDSIAALMAFVERKR